MLKCISLILTVLVAVSMAAQGAAIGGQGQPHTILIARISHRQHTTPDQSFPPRAGPPQQLVRLQFQVLLALLKIDRIAIQK